ncbi:MAG: SIMPL domain-containing protein [Patescibacteria group bacterium]
MLNVSETIRSKNFFWVTLNLILLAAAIIIWKILIFGLPVFPDQHTITVSAEGKTVVSPDIASLSFSVVTEGMDPKKIQTENTQKMNDAIAFIKAEGIEAKDIKTENYNLYPKYDYLRESIQYPGGTQVLSGYRVMQTVRVKIRDFEKVPTILGALPGKGINQIDNLSFDVEDPDTFLNVAREEAFEKARAKAQAMAKANGVRIKRVVTFSEGSGGYPMYFKTEAAYGMGGSDAASVPSPTIEPGSQDVTVNVTVTYEVR